MGEGTCKALIRFQKSGGLIFLTTGETLDELADFPHLDLFNLIVAENGALLYEPTSGEECLLAKPPPTRLLRELRRKGIHPLQTGRVIISTHYSQEAAVSEVLEALAIGWRLIRNRHDVMILPSNITKATGLCAALRKFGLAPHQAVGIGDAENDIALLEICGCGVAVANAVPALKKRASFITRRGMGSGVAELIDHLLKDSLPQAPAGQSG